MRGPAGRLNKSAFEAVAVALGVLLFCALSYASGGGGGEHAAAQESGKLLDLLYRFINFALLVIILVVVVKKTSIKDLLANRREEIRRKLEELQKGRDDAESRHQELEKKLKEFEKERVELIEQFREEGLKEKERIVAEAKERARQIVEQAGLTIEYELKSAKEKLGREVMALAAQKAEEIISTEMTDEDQDRLVDEFIERVGKAH